MKARLFVMFVLVAVLSVGLTLTVTAQGTMQDWIRVNISGFGNSSNGAVWSLAPFNNQLYAGTSDFSGGAAQLWRKGNDFT